MYYGYGIIRANSIEMESLRLGPNQEAPCLIVEGELGMLCAKVCNFCRADPTPFTDEEVLYAFGIIKPTQEDIVNLLGMEDRPCRIVENGNMGMLVYPVPRKEYNEESIHRYMEDMDWVESHARRHEEILLKTMEGRSVIPLPFCTIFTDEGNIKRLISPECHGDTR